MIFTNPGPEQICQMLRSIHTIAMVGLSPNPARPSFRVARGMQGYGYRIAPSPAIGWLRHNQRLGERCWLA